MDKSFTEKEIAAVRKVLGLRDDQMLVLFSDREQGVAGVMQGDAERMYATLSKVMVPLKKQMIVGKVLDLMGELASMR